jgi:hypothetical protein
MHRLVEALSDPLCEEEPSAIRERAGVTVAVLVVAAGRGSRALAAAGGPKQYALLAGRLTAAQGPDVGEAQA